MSTRLGRLLGAGIVTGTIVLTGCSSSSEGQEASAPAGPSALYNDADVTFAQGMIPHHRQAVEMADLVEGRAQDPRVTDLAARIEAAQEPEIDTLTGWLEDWGQEVPGTGAGDGAMDHGAMDHGGAGMMTAGDLDALRGSSGAEFDRMFLEQMIEHHTGAVEMAEAEVAEGEFAEAVDMAESITATQTAEISEMQQIRSTLAG
jgi:uncharacterized protein (DUF305 family)